MADGQRPGPWNLSGEELRKLTKWPDQVIADYLYLQRTASEVTNIINVVNNSTTVIEGNVSLNSARIEGAIRSLTSLQEGVNSLAALTSKTATERRDLQRNLNTLQQAMQAFTALPNKVASLKRDLQRVITGNSQSSASLEALLAEARGLLNTLATYSQKKLRGTTNAAASGTTSVAHGLTSSKILSCSILVTVAGVKYEPNVPLATHEFYYTIDATNINVINGAVATAILAMPFTVLLTREE